MENIELRKFEDSDLIQIKNWYLNMVEWQLWDVPWEEVEYDENGQKNIRHSRSNNSPCFEFEIFFQGNHVGWISAYYMTEDFKYNGLDKTDKIAIGIDIPDENMRGKGIGTMAIKKYLEYFKKLGYEKIYTQTWSGNTRMINVANKIGFKEVNRYIGIRNVRNKKYDALTFEITL